MKRIVGTILAWIGGITVVLFILFFVVVTIARPTRGTVPGKAILELNLESAIVEVEPEDPFARLVMKEQPVLRNIVEALQKAGDDSRVTGLIATIGAAPMSLAQAQELRDAVTAFRAKKKFAVAFSETFGEFGPGNGAYYLATAFDEIWLQPSGDVGLNGLLLQAMFLRGALDKLGVVPRMDHRYEYKNAMNTFTDKRFTPAFQEAMTAIRDSYFSQMVRGIAQGRKLSEEEVRAIVNRGPLLGGEALQAKLVDGLAYRDEVYAKVKQKGGDAARLIYAGAYLNRAGRPHQSGPVVALIYGVGPVVRGESSFDPLEGASTMGSDSVTAAFRQAIDDNAVKAILFRVDSPGGSYVASDAIWRETVRARKAGKPVVVSMGSVAGSGGYFVAMSADKIVAQPGTITGSIGVLGGKMLTNGLWEKLGISWDEVHAGDHAEMFSSQQDYSAEEWARFQAWLDRVYSDFTTKVAQGRNLPKEKVLEVAKGRIWTGEQAKARGLVDETGGYPAAIKLVKQAIKLQESDSITLRVYPKRKSTFEAILAELQEQERESSEATQAELMLRTMRRLRPAVKVLQTLGLDPDYQRGVLAMPEFIVKQ